MPGAIILLNCEIGSEEFVIKELKKIEIVKEAYGTFGSYDVFIKLESDSAEELNGTITDKIRTIDNVRTTLTLLPIEG